MNIQQPCDHTRSGSDARNTTISISADLLNTTSQRQLVTESKPVTLNTTGRETPYYLLTSGLQHGPWRPAAANK